MTPQDQARQEIADELTYFIAVVGLSPMASISLADVRKLMELAWVRGYSAHKEASAPVP